ncbi:MAG: ferritin-like domain-containing protein, partial [Gemmatimonadota bacterium]
MITGIKRLITIDPEKLQTPTGRRSFFAEIAVAAGAVSLAPAILRGLNPRGRAWALAAQQGGETEDLTDIEILQYALTLEYLEATFYLRGDNASPLPGGATIAQIDPDGNGLPGTVTGLAAVTPRAPATFSVPTFVRAVRNHEIEHVLFLQGALGAAALPRAEFEFTFPPGTFDSADAFLTLAQTLEDTGVTAYLGQVPNIDSVDILVDAGTI